AGRQVLWIKIAVALACLGRHRDEVPEDIRDRAVAGGMEPGHFNLLVADPSVPDERMPVACRRPRAEIDVIRLAHRRGRVVRRGCLMRMRAGRRGWRVLRSGGTDAQPGRDCDGADAQQTELVPTNLHLSPPPTLLGPIADRSGRCISRSVPTGALAECCFPVGKAARASARFGETVASGFGHDGRRLLADRGLAYR